MVDVRVNASIGEPMDEGRVPQGGLRGRPSNHEKTTVSTARLRRSRGRRNRFLGLSAGISPPGSPRNHSVRNPGSAPTTRNHNSVPAQICPSSNAMTNSIGHRESSSIFAVHPTSFFRSSEGGAFASSRAVVDRRRLSIPGASSGPSDGSRRPPWNTKHEPAVTGDVRAQVKRL